AGGDIAFDAVVFGVDAADGRAGEDDGVGLDHAAKCGGFAAAPDSASAAAAFGETGGEVACAVLVLEPRGIADSRVHGDRDGEGAAGDEVVDDGGDGVDADGVVVVAFAGELLDGIGDQVLGAEALFDVGEVFDGCFEEVG